MVRREVLAEGVEIWLGDSRELEPPAGIDCIVTSPPYNQMDDIAKRAPSGLWGDKTGGLGFVSNWKENGYSDDVSEAEYQAQQNELFARFAPSCSPTASLFYNHQIRWRDGVALHPIKWFQPEGWNLRTEIIWDRGGGMMFNARMFVRFDERIIWFVRGGQWKWNQASVGLGTVWRVAREQNKEHPVAFPSPTSVAASMHRMGSSVVSCLILIAVAERVALPPFGLAGDLSAWSGNRSGSTYRAAMSPPRFVSHPCSSTLPSP